MSATPTLKPIEMDLETWRARLESELARLVDLLVREFSPHKIILFGSLAEGKPRLWSDIDLVVVMDTEKRFLDRSKDILLAFHPHVGVDVLVYTPQEFERLCRERPFFKEEIVGKGEVLYERPS